MECPICYEYICNDNNVVKINCSHKFHASCLFKHLSVKNNCPCCRTKLIERDEDSESLYSENDDNLYEDVEFHRISLAKEDYVLDGFRWLFQQACNEKINYIDPFTETYEVWKIQIDYFENEFSKKVETQKQIICSELSKMKCNLEDFVLSYLHKNHPYYEFSTLSSNTKKVDRIMSKIFNKVGL